MADNDHCSSCRVSVANLTGTVKFQCPKCGKTTIVRCPHCRKIGAKYTCPECGFLGPN